MGKYRLARIIKESDTKEDVLHTYKSLKFFGHNVVLIGPEGVE